jgi:hypothetical protein
MPLADDTARNAAGAGIRAFFDALKTYIPNGTSISVQAQIDELDTVSGDLLSSAAMTVIPAVVTSTATAVAYAAGSGFCVTWQAGGVFNGRRIKGRTFIVPAVGCYETDGTLTAGVISAVQTAGAALIATAGADLAIWNRAYNDATPPVATSGLVTSATTCVVKDTAAQLRSRRV